MPSGLQFVSTTAATGMFRRRASAMAIASLLVSMTKSRSGMPPMSLMPPSARSSLSRSRVSDRRSFLVRPCTPSASIVVELAQPLDRMGDRLPVGEHAAEPAGVHVILRAAAGRFGDRVRGLPLGADEEDAAALGDGVAHLLQRAVQHRHGLREVDDVDVVAGAVDVRGHLRVPAMRLVTEMHASLEQLAHRKIGKRHKILRFVLRGKWLQGSHRKAGQGFMPACEMARI